eukprot:7377968-Prymnesium_polylepis.1
MGLEHVKKAVARKSCCFQAEHETVRALAARHEVGCGCRPHGGRFSSQRLGDTSPWRVSGRLQASALPLFDGALPVLDGALPVPDGALPVPDGALSVPDDSFPPRADGTALQQGPWLKV